MCHWKERYKGRGFGGLCLSPFLGLPTQYFYRGSHSTGTSAGSVVLMGKKILSFISSAK